MSVAKDAEKFTGGCACRAIRYTLPSLPIWINACHCSYCQRETGSSFAVNAMYERAAVTITSTTSPQPIDTPTESGNGQRIFRCPKCFVAVWSQYGQSKFSKITIVRVGTLDDPREFAPKTHIYTASKPPWVVIPEGVPAFENYYDKGTVWPQENLDRLAKALESSD